MKHSYVDSNNDRCKEWSLINSSHDWKSYKKCTTINRMNSKRKLDTSLANVHVSVKIKDACNNGNDDKAVWSGQWVTVVPSGDDATRQHNWSCRLAVLDLSVNFRIPSIYTFQFIYMFTYLLCLCFGLLDNIMYVLIRLLELS